MDLHLSKLSPFKGKQLHLTHDRLSATILLAENDTDLVHLSLVVQIKQHIADLSCPAEGRILCRIQEGSVNVDMPAHEILPPVLSNHKKRSLPVLPDLRLGLLQNIAVIRTRKSLVRRDHKIGVGLGLLPSGLRIEVMTVHVTPPLEDPSHFRFLQTEIRQRPVQIRPCLCQLRGSDQVHGVGDLLCVSNALYSVFDLFRIGHITYNLPQILSKCG